MARINASNSPWLAKWFFGTDSGSSSRGRPCVYDGCTWKRPPPPIGPTLTGKSGQRRPQTRPWQCLNFFPEPQGHCALRGVPAHGARGPAGRGPPRSAPLPEPARRWVRGDGSGLPVVPVARASSAIASSGSAPAIAKAGCCTRSSTWLSTEVTCWRRLASIASNNSKASRLYSLSGSRWA